MASPDTSVCACATLIVGNQVRAQEPSANHSTVLFTVCVLHWATAIDKQDRTTTSNSQSPEYTFESRGGLNSTTDGKADDYVELDERHVAKLTTVIEAKRGSLDPTVLNSHAIAIKTQHVREVETEPYNIDSESGICGESQERLIEPGSI